MNQIQSFFDSIPALGGQLRSPELRTLVGQGKAALGAWYLCLFGTRGYGSPALPGAFLQKLYPELVRRALLKKTDPEDAVAALALAELVLWESGALSYTPEAHGALDEKTCGFIRARLAQGDRSEMFLALMRLQHAYGRHVDSQWAALCRPEDPTPGFLDIPGDRGPYDLLARQCWDEAQRYQMQGMAAFA